MKLAAIIVAGGSGKRFGSKEPKQFLSLNKKPMFLWSVLAFQKIKECAQIILVVPENKLAATAKYKKAYSIDVVSGGRERFLSVKNGLDAVAKNIDLVAVHDAARPLVTQKMIKSVIAEAGSKKYAGAVAAAVSKDSVKFSKNGKTITSSLDRNNVWQAQTPQIFKTDILKKVYSEKIAASVTDDSQLVEKTGRKVALVKSFLENFKVTEPSDFTLAENILKKRNSRC